MFEVYGEGPSLRSPNPLLFKLEYFCEFPIWPVVCRDSFDINVYLDFCTPKLKGTLRVSNFLISLLQTVFLGPQTDTRNQRLFI